MIQYETEDVEIVQEITGLNKAEAEKYLVQYIKDIEIDDGDILDVLDGIREEQEAKKNAPRQYVTSTTPKKTRTVVKKVAEDKKAIIDIIYQALTDNGYNAVITNVDKIIDIPDKEMTINLTKHSYKKKKKK